LLACSCLMFFTRRTKRFSWRGESFALLMAQVTKGSPSHSPSLTLELSQATNVKQNLSCLTTCFVETGRRPASSIGDAVITYLKVRVRLKTLHRPLAQLDSRFVPIDPGLLLRPR